MRQIGVMVENMWDSRYISVSWEGGVRVRILNFEGVFV